MRFGRIALARSGRRPLVLDGALVIEGSAAIEGCALSLAVYRAFGSGEIIAAFAAVHSETGARHQDAAPVGAPGALASFLRGFEPARVLPTPPSLFDVTPSEGAADVWREHAEACRTVSAAFAALTERLCGPDARPWNDDAALSSAAG